jgi:hypothetical protein
MLTADLHLVPRRRMSGVVPLLLLYVFVMWTGTALSFTFYSSLFHALWRIISSPLSAWPAVPIGWQPVLRSSISCIKDKFALFDLLFSTEVVGSRFFRNVGDIDTFTRPCQSKKNGITITPRLVTLVICLISPTLYCIAFACWPMFATPTWRPSECITKFPVTRNKLFCLC